MAQKRKIAEEDDFSAFDTPEDFSVFDSPKEEGPGLLSRAGGAVLSGLGTAAEYADRYAPGGAAMRSAISSLQEDVTDPGRAAKAYMNQYGKPTETAPTMKSIVEKAGVPPEYSGPAGLYLDVFTPTGMGAAFKGMGKGVGLLAKAAPEAEELARAAGSKISQKVAGATEKVGSAFTGVPEKNIETYLERPEKIRELFNKYQGDFTQASDDVREQFVKAIQGRRQALNQQYSAALKAIPEERVVDPSPLLETLYARKAEFEKLKRADSAAGVQKLIDKVEGFLPEKTQSQMTRAYSLGEKVPEKITPQQLNEVKNYFQTVADPAYLEGGQIFPGGKDIAKVAKNSARDARKMMIPFSEDLASANAGLEKLRIIEGKINKNLIAPGGPEGALMAAGSGANPRSVKTLSRLEKEVGGGLLEKAQDLSSARQFYDAALLPVDTTGKSMTRANLATALTRGALGAGTGYLLGNEAGAILGAAASSPLGLKKAMDAGIFTANQVRKFADWSGPLTEKALQKASDYLKTPQGSREAQILLRTAGQAKGLMNEK